MDMKEEIKKKLGSKKKKRASKIVSNSAMSQEIQKFCRKGIGIGGLVDKLRRDNRRFFSAKRKGTEDEE